MVIVALREFADELAEYETVEDQLVSAEFPDPDDGLALNQEALSEMLYDVLALPPIVNEPDPYSTDLDEVVHATFFTIQ